MINRVKNSIKFRLDDGSMSPSIRTSGSWSTSGYKFDDSNYNYDAYEVTPFENEQAAYMSVCALADYASGIVPNLGQVDVGSVQNVNLSGVNSHKDCLSGLGSSIGSTINRMGTALNARYKAEVEAGTLFGGQDMPADLDYAAYIRNLSFENSSDILNELNSFTADNSNGTFGDGVYDPKTTLSTDWTSLKESDPEAYKTQLDQTYNAARNKDSSEWTADERYAIFEHYQDLQTQYADAKSRHEEAANWGGYDDEAYTEMGRLSKEMKGIESQLKSAGLMEYTDRELAKMDFAQAWNGFTEAIDRKIAAEESGDEEAFREAERVQFATMAQFTDTVVTGVKKIGEDVADSALKAMGYIATSITKLNDVLFHTNETEKMWDSIRSEIAVDRTSEAEQSKHENVQRWIDNDQYTTFQYDGAAAKATKEAVEDGGVMLLAAATGGNPIALAGAVTVAGMKGDGEKAEELYNVQDGNGSYVYRNAKGDAIASMSGVKTAVEAYGTGKVAGALSGAGDVKILADGTKTYTGNALKDAAGNALKNADMYIFEAGNVANSLESGLETGDYKLGELAAGTVAIGAGTLATEYSAAVKAANDVEKSLTLAGDAQSTATSTSTGASTAKTTDSMTSSGKTTEPLQLPAKGETGYVPPQNLDSNPFKNVIGEYSPEVTPAATDAERVQNINNALGTNYASMDDVPEVVVGKEQKYHMVVDNWNSNNYKETSSGSGVYQRRDNLKSISTIDNDAYGSQMMTAAANYDDVAMSTGTKPATSSTPGAISDTTKTDLMDGAKTLGESIIGQGEPQYRVNPDGTTSLSEFVVNTDKVQGYVPVKVGDKQYFTASSQVTYSMKLKDGKINIHFYPTVK